MKPRVRFMTHDIDTPWRNQAMDRLAERIQVRNKMHHRMRNHQVVLLVGNVPNVFRRDRNSSDLFGRIRRENLLQYGHSIIREHPARPAPQPSTITAAGLRARPLLKTSASRNLA